MSFCSFSKENSISGKTFIDNNFINNYMLEATGDANKVYLYGLYLCQNSSDDMNLETFSKDLSLSTTEVIDYFKYWDDYGLITIVSTEPFLVKYNFINENSTKYKRIKPEKYEDFTKSLQLIITERMIQISEYSEYFNLLETTPLKQEALLMIAKYCVDIQGGKINGKYILKVAKDFVNRGILTDELVAKELSYYLMNTGDILEIFKKLKINKNPEIEDQQLYKKWVNNFGFDNEFIIFVANNRKVKNFKKLDEYLLELYCDKCFTTEEVKNHFANIDYIKSLAYEINKTLGIYIEVVDNVIKTYTMPWNKLGYDKETLLFIANYCFKKNKRTLESMDETIKNLHKLGLTTVKSITIYMENRQLKDSFIIKCLQILGLNRKPTNWDRDNLQTWHDWGFDDDMILEATKRSVSASNPILYMNSILSNWKSQNVYKVEDIKQKISNTSNNFANERKYSNEELDKLFDNIDDFKF